MNTDARNDELHSQMRQALCEPNFLELFDSSEGDQKETVVAEQLARRNVGVTLLSVKKAPHGADGDYLVQWRPTADDFGNMDFWLTSPK